MLRQLIVLRHAKSSWSSDATSDHERPLNPRGKADAPQVAARLVELGWIPDRVLCSDAKRTRQTWKRMSKTMRRGKSDIEVTHHHDLYLASLDDVVAAVAAVPAEVECVMVVGHNPTCEQVVGWLAKEDVRVTTANALLMRCESDDWITAMTESGRFELVDVVRPKDLQ